MQDVQAIWQPDEFKAASGVVVKSDGDDRAIPPLGAQSWEGRVCHQRHEAMMDYLLHQKCLDVFSTHLYVGYTIHMDTPQW